MLRQDRYIVIACLCVVVSLSWLFLLTGAGLKQPAFSVSDMAIPRPGWDVGYAAIMLLMWWIMMMAMMLPSAAPMILLYTALSRRSEGGGVGTVAAFVLAYVFVWGGFSVLATASQWGLERTQLLSPMMNTTSVLAGGVLLIAAGLWQLTPLKHACLHHCRSPIHFFAQGWRTGKGGAFRMGLQHGAVCLGCCWVLMTVLFYAGVMDLRWIAGLAIYMIVEKTAPRGHLIGRGTGLLLVVWGAAIIAFQS
jgi:predicted metal-binding membrane protein